MIYLVRVYSIPGGSSEAPVEPPDGDGWTVAGVAGGDGQVSVLWARPTPSEASTEPLSEAP